MQKQCEESNNITQSQHLQKCTDAIRPDQPYIRITLDKFLKTNQRFHQNRSYKNNINNQITFKNKPLRVNKYEYKSIDKDDDIQLNFKQEKGFLLQNQLSKHSLQIRDKKVTQIQGFSNKYSEFVNKIKFYNQSRLKTIQPLKIQNCKLQSSKQTPTSIYQQRIYKKAMQQKQKLYPFLQKRSKTQHQIKGTLKDSKLYTQDVNIRNIESFTPLYFKLYNSNSEQEELLQDKKMKEKRFLIKTANRKMLRRQFGSNHSINDGNNKELQRKMSKKKSQDSSSNSLETELKFVQQTVIQNRRLVPNMGLLRSKQKSVQIRQKLRIKYSKYQFFQQDHYNSNKQKNQKINKQKIQFKIDSQFNNFKEGLKGWDFANERNTECEF